MDDVMLSPEEAAEAGIETTRQKIRVHERHFGALSEGGMSVRIADEEGVQTMLSKVDVPYARFSLQHYHHDPEARNRINEAEKKLESGEDEIVDTSSEMKVKPSKGSAPMKGGQAKLKLRAQTADQDDSGVPLTQALNGRLSDVTRRGKLPKHARSRNFAALSPSDDSMLLATLDTPLTTNPLIRKHRSEPRIIHQPAPKQQQVKDAADDAARIEDKVRAKQSARLKEIARLKMHDQQTSSADDDAGAGAGGVVRRYVDDRLAFAAEARSDMRAERATQTGPIIHRHHVSGLEDMHMHNRDTSRPLSEKLVRSMRRDEVGERDDGSASVRRAGMVRDMLERRRAARGNDRTVSETLDYTSEEWMEKMRKKDSDGQLFL